MLPGLRPTFEFLLLPSLLVEFDVCARDLLAIKPSLLDGNPTYVSPRLIFNILNISQKVRYLSNMALCA